MSASVLADVRTLVGLLRARANKAQSFGHEIYGKVDVVSAERRQNGVEILFRFLPDSLPQDSLSRVKRTELCGIVDATTSTAAWFSHPQQHLTVSAEMSFSFLRDAQADREVLIRAAVDDCIGNLGFTTGEVLQDGKTVLTAKHTVFYLNKTIREAFGLGKMPKV